MRRRLLIDSSFILKRDLWAAINGENSYEVEFEGKSKKIPSHIDAYDIVLSNIHKALRDLRLTPIDIVLVKDCPGCKEPRRKIFSNYCANRKPGPPNFYEEFNKLQDMVEETLLKYGAISVQGGEKKPEADDILYALADKVDCVVMSGDSDAYQCNADIYDKGEINKEKFFDIAKEYIPVYKAIVGDSSDGLTPAAKGFGDKTFVDFLSTFGDEALGVLKTLIEEERLEELAEDVDEFKSLQKIIDCKEDVYACYKCAKPMEPGWDLDWKLLYPEGNGEFKQWEPVQELITKDKLTDEFLARLAKEIKAAPYVSLDIETFMLPEGKKWSAKNKKSNDKQGPLDIYGSRLAGFSITVGENSHISYYFPVKHFETDNISMKDAENILNMLPDSEDVPVLVHNSSFELVVLRKHFELKFDRGYLPSNTIDTRILAGFVNENESPSLKHWSKKLMDYDQVKYEEVIGDKGGMDELTGEEVVSYGIDDSCVTACLYNHFDLFTRYEESLNSYLICDQATQFLYAEAFLNGIRVDMNKVKELQKDNSKKYEETYSRIQDFLIQLEWKEEKEIQKVPTRVTLANLKEAKELAKQPVEIETIVHKWPGCEYVPVKELTPAEVKRVYEDLYGEKLKTNVRKLDKLAAIIDENGHPEYASKVANGSPNGVNEYAMSEFVPSPTLNLRSPKQLTELLYTALGYPIRVRNKLTDKQREKGQRDGNPASNESAVRHAIMYDASDAEKDFLQDLLAAKSCLTEDSLFYTPYQNLTHWESGMVHPNLGQGMAKTGRGNANNPNISQLSHKSPIRQAFLPYEGEIFCSFDKSSQEIGHCAWHSQDENLLDCFRGDRLDVHSLTGVEVYNLTHEDLTYDEFISILNNEDHPLYKEVKAARKKAKSVNFLDIYSGSAPTLAESLLITVEEAQAMLDAKARAFPGVAKWKEDMEKLHRERGYAVTPLGRRKHLILDGTFRDNHELRSAGNFPIQAGAGEEIKQALAKAWKRKVYERYSAGFLFPVHDEADNSCDPNELGFIKEFHEIMTEPYADFGITILSSIEIGPNFKELHEFGTEFNEEEIRKFIDDMKI